MIHPDQLYSSLRKSWSHSSAGPPRPINQWQRVKLAAFLLEDEGGSVLHWLHPATCTSSASFFMIWLVQMIYIWHFLFDCQKCSQNLPRTAVLTLMPPSGRIYFPPFDSFSTSAPPSGQNLSNRLDLWPTFNSALTCPKSSAREKVVARELNLSFHRLPREFQQQKTVIEPSN